MSPDTIAAPASPPGHGGVAVVRISGAGTLQVLARIVHKPPAIWQARRLYYRTFVDEGEALDRGMVVFFKAPASFTGEDAAEFHVHGNPFLVQALLTAITRVPGVRLAKPGEFSHRAYLHSKMDLPQAEALNQLIAATSDTAYRLSLNGMSGGVSHLAIELRLALLDLAACVETDIEFAQDQQLEMTSLLEPLSKAKNKIAHLLRKSAFYDHLSRGVRLVIVGPANAGKSSLFNALLGENRAIVSEQPGTTRDVLRERFYLHQVAIELLDTAGFNPQTDDLIEQAGIERAMAALADASAVLFVLDVERPLQGWEVDFCRRLQDKPLAILLNKTDLLADVALPVWTKQFSGFMQIALSVKTGQGIETVNQLLAKWTTQFKPTVDDVMITARQRELLEHLEQGLEQISSAIERREMIEILAEEIRSQLDYIAMLTGELTPEHILNHLFSTFCIGK